MTSTLWITSGCDPRSDQGLSRTLRLKPIREAPTPSLPPALLARSAHSPPSTRPSGPPALRAQERPPLNTRAGMSAREAAGVAAFRGAHWLSLLCQSGGTAPRGPGVPWEDGWLSGGAKFGPSMNSPER